MTEHDGRALRQLAYRTSALPKRATVWPVQRGVPLQYETQYDWRSHAHKAAAAGPGATLLYDDWHPALRPPKISGKQMATAMLLGLPLVPGRTTAGRYFAIRDTCPHRGIPLSYGWFDGRRC